MEDLDELEKFIAHAKEYGETRMDLMALNTQDRMSRGLSSMISVLIPGILIMVTLLFLSIGGAWRLGQVFGSLSTGFFWVGGFYLIAGIIIYFFREQWIKVPMVNFMLKKINSHEEDQ